MATSVPLAARRLLPLATFWMILGGVFLTSHDTTLVTFVAVVFAGYNAAARSRFRGPALLSLAAAAALVMIVFPDSAPPLPARATPLAVLVPVAIVGNAVHIWRRRAGDSQDRLCRLAAEHEAATRRALDLERARIASELHDVVTHNVSVMVIQAGAARRVLAQSPGEAREAMLAVESSGRTAMTELRHLLGLLSPPSGPASAPDAGPAGPAQALRPQPGLGQLGSLIAPVRAAGVPVRLQVQGDCRELPPGLDMAAYRVIQEALTNVIKHAAPARATVRLSYRPGRLELDIADDGPAGSGSRAAPEGPGLREPGHPGVDRPLVDRPLVDRPGRGLLGLRERMALYGGTLDAGPRPGGGWRVLARVPLDPAAGDPATGGLATGILADGGLADGGLADGGLADGGLADGDPVAARPTGAVPG